MTGGTGKLGRAVVEDLISRGYDVINVDRTPPRERKCPFVEADLSDFGQAFDALGGRDEATRPHAIVHLAAIPAPRLKPDAETFRNNTLGDFHVFETARRLGIKHVVWASSETVLGLPFDVPPVYVPVDEEVPPRPESAYSLSKLLGETMAAQFCRWDPTLKIIGLRFSNVMARDDYAHFPTFTAAARKWNLWGYIDARDAAQAVRLSVESKITGAEVFIIANADTALDRPNHAMLNEIFPGVPRKRTFGENESLLAIEKAKRVLGYVPKYSWRNV